MIDQILQFVYPSYCCECRVFLDCDRVACSPCLEKIKPVASCEFAVNKQHKLRVHAAGSYDGPLRSLILRKASFDRHSAQQLGRLLVEQSFMQSLTVDTIVPIPLHWTRYAYRGFNQAEVLAHVLGSHLDVPVVSAIKRVRRTPFQSLLTSQQREQNVRNVFRRYDFSQTFESEYLYGKHILLVDDLCTTGATLVQAARSLTVFRPATIIALVAARAV